MLSILSLAGEGVPEAIRNKGPISRYQRARGIADIVRGSKAMLGAGSFISKEGLQVPPDAHTPLY